MSQRALVVDDDPSWQDILTDILVDLGLEVDVAATADEAIRQVRSSSHRLAIVDLSLSASDHANRDGLQVLDAIQRHAPSCQAVLLTGFATVDVVVSVLREKKAETCLQKESFSSRDLAALVQDALARPRDHSIEPAPAVAERPAASGWRGRSLVVDDDAGWRSYLTEMLEDIGFSVSDCASFAEALGLLRRGSWRLAVVDVQLAHSAINQDGYHLLNAARHLDVPTIVVSGTVSSDEIVSAWQAHNPTAWLEKQAFDRDTFVRLVNHATGGDESMQSIEFTAREREVLQLLQEGLTNSEIGERLFISINTVKQHLKTIFEKLGVKTRAAAVSKSRNIL